MIFRCLMTVTAVEIFRSVGRTRRQELTAISSASEISPLKPLGFHVRSNVAR
jgi:hypothetical protein